jgi:hypothetical protein
MAIDKTNNQSNHYFKPKTSYTLRQKKTQQQQQQQQHHPQQDEDGQRIQRETQQHPTQGNGWRMEKEGEKHKRTDMNETQQQPQQQQQ